MLHSQQLVESLIELRSQYQAQQEEDQRSSAHAKEQLAHINALLVEQLMRQHNQQPVSIQASTVNENPALTQATSLSREESPTAFDKVDELSQVDEPNEPEVANQVGEPKQINQPTSPTLTVMVQSEADLNASFTEAGGLSNQQPSSPAPIAAPSEAIDDMDSNEFPSQLDEQDSPELESKKADRYKLQRRKFSSKSTEEMLPRYQQLNFTEAVEAVVQENAGEILTTDKVARTLYGELSGPTLTKAKEKVGKTLWSGAKQKRWQRVPGQMGAYTLDIQLVAPTELG